MKSLGQDVDVTKRFHSEPLPLGWRRRSWCNRDFSAIGQCLRSFRAADHPPRIDLVNQGIFYDRPALHHELYLL
jgi:hypothetical protein